MTRFQPLILFVLFLTFCKGDFQNFKATKSIKIVTTTPSATELVAALDQTKHLVAVDKFSTFPKEVISLPKIGDFMSPNVEAIAKLKPSLVVLDKTQVDAERMLQKIGIKTLALPMLTIADVKHGLLELGNSLNISEKASSAIADIDRSLQKARTAPQSASSNQTLVVIDRAKGKPMSLIAAGPKSYFDELLKSVNLTNALSDSKVDYPNVSLETVFKKSPNLIIDVSIGSDDAISDWQSIPHFVDTKVVSFKEPYFLSPSPRVYLAIEALYALREQLN